MIEDKISNITEKKQIIAIKTTANVPDILDGNFLLNIL